MHIGWQKGIIMMNRLLFCGFLALSIAQPVQAMVKPDAKSKTAAKTARAPTKVAAQQMEKASSPAPSDLSPEQLAIAEKVYLGKIPCELGAHVTMKADQRATGRFLLEAGQKRYTMTPVVTSTGAVRLEDATSGAVWVQIANKSMLMNQKLGKRLADECMHPEQLQVAQALRLAPARSLFEPAPSTPVESVDSAQATPAAATATE